jgi:hypothetical protein
MPASELTAWVSGAAPVVMVAGTVPDVLGAAALSAGVAA